MSSFDVGGILKRGEVYPSGHNTDVYGRTFTFPNLTNLTNRAPRDPRMVWMKYVKNGEASLALLPGQLVAWKTAQDGAGQGLVVYPAATAGVQIAGVVDHLIPAAGCAAGSACLIVVLGPTKMLLDNNATSAEFDNLINSGGVAGCVRAGTTSGAIVGRNEAAGTTAAGTAGTIAAATSFWGFFSALGTGP
jgi:hypothetical protein